MKKYIILLAAVCTLVGCSSKRDYYVAAYIWPSCHDDAMAREYLWPDGEGEWEVIKKGNPRFEGHYQPRLPYWGYEHDNDPTVVEKWINTALKYGVNTFVYDWYWFDGKPFLESALNDGFLKAPSNEKMNFYLTMVCDSPEQLWQEDILERERVLGYRRVYRPLLAYKMLYDLADKKIAAYWELLLDAKDETIVSICGALEQAGEQEMAKAFRFLMANYREKPEKIKDFVEGNSRYIRGKMIGYVKKNIELFY